MNLDEFRIEMEASRRVAEEEASSARYSQLALNRLCELYERFDAEERVMADQVIEEWALSEDENVRFDALALIGRYGITRAVATLEKLAARLASSSALGAPYELEKVNRILGKFAGT
jgi:hypothetical protein